uniref:isoleucine--tRNA ligase n=1 Tax=Gossypium raimondii TaxID=29730 RepID=A0A0D2Q6Q2_GOSRA|nr:hypothetical protein B456_006G096300 [Gossypium raimondii]
MSFFKSVAANSSVFTPREAKMAMRQPSTYRVLSQRAGSSLRKTTSVNLLYFRGSSSVRVFSFLNIARYSSCSREEFYSSSKRRSRGPVMAAKKASQGQKEEEGRYKHTVDLPKTTFGMRANALVREPEIQKLWDDHQVFKRVVDKNDGGNFVLHDGPPYANGDLHMGHALNKILKDIINRYKLLQNYKVHFVPGWDCHGLPIELKVLQSLDQDARKDLTPLKLRAKAAKFAKATVKAQMSSFQRFGVWADWNNPYLTLDPKYEAAQIEVFGEMALKGHIYRGRKPVHWSPSSSTALAEAELEYPEGHVSRSIYALFRMVSTPSSKDSLLEEFFPDICLAIWTTTPWTVPANAAVAVNAKLQYAVVEAKSLSEDVHPSAGNKKKRLGNIGTDQHRGWFQSSLLTSIAAKGKAPYSSVITHGFVLDEKGLKMSKSLGNVVDPHTIIEGGKNQKEAPGYGADIMRLWVSSVDYTGDVMIGPQILRQMSDVYRKLRGTLRYLLGNLHDWKVENAVSYQELPMIDRHALFQLENVVKNIREGYENYQFFKIFQIVQRFVNVDLSNFYFDIAKDRLYVGGTTSFTRRSCQTVLAAHLLSLSRVIAPILPHLAEDAWQNLPFQYTIKDGSIAGFVFESKWPSVNEKWLAFPAEEVDFWGKVLELRTEVNKVLEIARTGKLIGSSLEAKVYLHVSDASLASRLLEMCSVNNDADALHRIFLTSQVEVVPSLDHELVQNISHTGEYVVEDDRVWIGVSRADGSKCERCWNYSPQVGSFTEHPTLCGRCFNVVGIQPTPAMAAAIS